MAAPAKIASRRLAGDGARHIILYHPSEGRREWRGINSIDEILGEGLNAACG
jgi:hypothetical protein